jgi:S-DNA-T family DNA segregation ATPase FtsK/SpoIIIE
MDRRYHLLAQARVRNIAGYNEKVPELKLNHINKRVRVSRGRTELVDADAPGAELLDPPPDHEELPRIVVVIDEFADLIMQCGKEVEMAVARLAQKARAAGLHVILATQRPSTDVLTGIIKANFPTRVSFQVASGIDSKVVINGPGAESLLGNGDMLFLPPGTSAVRRCHGTWITDDEVVAIARHWRDQGRPDYDMDILTDPEADAPDAVADADLDPLFEDAVQIALEAEQASVSFLQRKLNIGYGRAARIVDHMESRGIVGPQRGPNKPREILIGAA